MAVRKTNEEFIKEVSEILGEGYEVLTEYVSAKTKVRIKHSCGNIYEATPDKIKSRGQKCPECYNAAKTRVKNHEVVFLKSFADLSKGEYELRSQYEGMFKSIDIKHIVCGHEYKVRPSNFVNGKRCPKCALIAGGIKRRKSREDFALEIKEKFNGNILVVTKYVDSLTNTEFRCQKHGFNFFTKPYTIINAKYACPKCAQGVVDSGSYKREVVENTNGEYLVLSNYNNSNEHVTYLHVVCGERFDKLPYDFNTREVPCTACSFKKRVESQTKPHGIFVEQIEEKYSGSIAIVSEYVGAFKLITAKCTDCGTEFSRSATSLLRGIKCPSCGANTTHGESRVEDYLKSKDIKFHKQYKFDDCRHIKPLPFDFCVLNGDSNIKCLIEFDGEQHFKPIKFFGGHEAFRKRKVLDEIKTTYCLRKGIKLVRIPYYEFDNIENILEQEVSGL
ncbi:DUF723 domain-containing protein [Peribacillus huizhouensis]|uniref:Zn-ribbon and HTH transcriptional regulator n=1 Tax=Peribacillus huizhouensis TaxID=1501239 RepID=A0ABR6CRD0_9BACI|nr:RAP domain-containing protein [Peribacillus huizhouensis]MBA9027515.1 putative Zn-ribbon and HTH transcriptional regulator [Peribacillus huizhouensis]